MKTKLGWVAIFVAFSAGVVALLRQHESQLRLQAELEELGRQNAERVRLREANRRLAETQPSETGLENLRADHVAISRLRAEITNLRDLERSAAAETARRSSERFAEGAKVPASEWTNAGRATSRETLETILWAAAGGDTDTFAKCLLLSDRIRQMATQLLERFPAPLREQYGTPERLIAFLACKDVPLGAATVVALNQVNGATKDDQVRLQLSAPDGGTRDLILRFAQQGDAWKLVVPEVAIAKYFGLLRGTSTATVVKGSPAKNGVK